MVRIRPELLASKLGPPRHSGSRTRLLSGYLLVLFQNLFLTCDSKKFDMSRSGVWPVRQRVRFCWSVRIDGRDGVSLKLFKVSDSLPIGKRAQYKPTSDALDELP